MCSKTMMHTSRVRSTEEADVQEVYDRPQQIFQPFFAGVRSPILIWGSLISDPPLAWQVFGWDETGSIELKDVICTENVAAGNGGCFYVSGGGLVNDGTVMTNNEGKYGGCICESRRGNGFWG